MESELKINTGLNRVGFNEKEAERAINKIKNSNSIHLVGVYSHLAATDDLHESKFTMSQISLFKKISSDVKSKLSCNPILHMSNTSGIYNYPECEFDMVRSGIGLYGYNNELNKELRPVHTLKSVIAQIINAKIVIFVKAFDDSFSQKVCSRMSYTDNEFVWNARFDSSIFEEDGKKAIDLQKLDNYIKI